MSPALPLELRHCIALYSSNASLHALSLTSRSWASESQRILYSAISLRVNDDDDTSTVTNSCVRTLLESDLKASFVRSLILDVDRYYSESDLNSTLAPMLVRLHRLRAMCVRGWPVALDASVWLADSLSRSFSSQPDLRILHTDAEFFYAKPNLFTALSETNALRVLAVDGIFHVFHKHGMQIREDLLQLTRSGCALFSMLEVSPQLIFYPCLAESLDAWRSQVHSILESIDTATRMEFLDPLRPDVQVLTFQLAGSRVPHLSYATELSAFFPSIKALLFKIEIPPNETLHIDSALLVRTLASFPMLQIAIFIGASRVGFSAAGCIHLAETLCESGCSQFQSLEFAECVAVERGDGPDFRWTETMPL